MTDLFVTSLSGASARQAVVEQSGSSAWLFMTGPNGEKPIADCFQIAVGGHAIHVVQDETFGADCRTFHLHARAAGDEEQNFVRAFHAGGKLDQAVFDLS